jgi:hypothetical protein
VEPQLQQGQMVRQKRNVLNNPAIYRIEKGPLDRADPFLCFSA